jgi:hypothetical protein
MTELCGHSSQSELTKTPCGEETYVVPLADVYLSFSANPVEIERYVKLCEHGEFYDLLLKRLGDRELDRSEFKVRMFRNVFFGKDQNSKFTREWKLFAAEFPSIAGVIRELKRRYGHNAVAWVLMRVESSLIINRICRRLMGEAPDIPVITIHDMLLTTPKNLDHVERVVREEYARVGLVPTLNNEDYRLMPEPKRAPKPKRKRRRRGYPAPTV